MKHAICPKPDLWALRKNDGLMPKNIQENTNERSLATTPTNNILVE